MAMRGGLDLAAQADAVEGAAEKFKGRGGGGGGGGKTSRPNPFKKSGKKGRGGKGGKMKGKGGSPFGGRC